VLVTQNVELFVSEQGQIRGPLRLEAIRREIASGEIKDALFRMEGCKRFLPGSAWDPLSDLFSAPSAPDPPEGTVAEALPRDLAKLEPGPRDKLLWYVEDADGVMGPVTGAFIARGLMTGRIPISSSVCLVSVPGWIRGTAVFPAALEGQTAIRARPLSTFSCPYCLEPVIIGSNNCLMCGESVALGEPHLSKGRFALLLASGLAMVLVPLLVGAYSVRSDPRATGAPIVTTNAFPLGEPKSSASASVSVSSQTPEVAASLQKDKPTNAPGELRKLTGEVAAKIDVPTDAEAALLLPQGHLAVARRASLDVIDPQSGVVVTSSREAQTSKIVEHVAGALYAVGPSRVAALDPASMRVLRWIEPRTQLAPGAAASDLALFPAPLDHSVVVLGTSHHVEVARLRFGLDIPGPVAIDASSAWAVVAVADPRSRVGPTSVCVFQPEKPLGAQLVRRLSLGDPIAALAVQDGRAFVALGSSRVVRIDLDTPGLLATPDLTKDTCTDPVLLRSAPGALLVGCRTGKALSLHAPATLAQDTRIELGGPVSAIEISPSGKQALVVTAAPLPGVFLIDLATGEPIRINVTDEISSVRFGKDGGGATAFSAKARRVWVLK